MAFTYDPASTVPATKQIAIARLHLADTSETPVFSDEEISLALSERGNMEGAVLWLLQTAIAYLANLPNLKDSGLEITNEHRLTSYTKLLYTKRREFGLPTDYIKRG